MGYSICIGIMEIKRLIFTEEYSQALREEQAARIREVLGLVTQADECFGCGASGDKYGSNKPEEFGMVFIKTHSAKREEKLVRLVPAIRLLEAVSNVVNSFDPQQKDRIIVKRDGDSYQIPFSNWTAVVERAQMAETLLGTYELGLAPFAADPRSPQARVQRMETWQLGIMQ